MNNERMGMQTWQGKYLNANILFSRAGMTQHIWVENENGAILFDVGDGILRDIKANKVDLDRLRGIFITHGHFDHVGGIHSLLGFMRMIGRKEKLPIFAPEGCIELSSIVENFIKCYPDTIPFEIYTRGIRPKQVFEIAGMNIEDFPVVHCGSVKEGGILNRLPAVGYRISYEGETIAISGDTGLCASLEKLISGADLAIIEATYESSDEASEEYLKKVHLSEDIAREIGGLAKDFILVHKGKRSY